VTVRPSTLGLIEDAHRFSPSYRGGFANHLPMALVALDGMHASDEEIAAFKRGYETQLEPLRDDERVRVERFREALAKAGVSAVLARLSTRMAEGIGSAAFHGAIRTAYALESGSEAEIAHALTYWDMAHAPLACDSLPRGNETPAEVLDAISRDPAYAGRKPSGIGIAGRMGAISRESGFQEYVARLDPAAVNLDLFAAALIRAYAATGDFTLLHGVTGCHAFRVLAPHFEHPRAALLRLWTAIVAAYMSCGSPALEGDIAANVSLSWEEIHRNAARRDDEHDVKFAYSCWREGQRTGDDLYRRAASARVPGEEAV
jgi:hypothetical protein